MRVLLDCRYVRVGPPDGVSRFTIGLAHALAARHPVELLISDPRQLAVLPDRPSHLLRAPTSVLEPLVALRVRRLRPDVVFSPMQTMGSWGRRHGLVLTVHDLIYYRHRTPPPQFAAPLRLLWRAYHLSWWPQRILLDRADAVVTVSDATASQIARHRLARRPVTVVPNAPDTAAPTAPRTSPTTRRLVYAGSFLPYKNVGTLARAMRELPDHELHLVSPVPDAERRRLTRLARGGGQLVFHDGASDDTYTRLLREATALVSASRDEGFGLPLVEAMSAGTPAVVSDIPAFREVGDDAPSYVAPDDPAGFATAVRALDDADLWRRHSAAGRRRAAHYSWERSARVLLDLLHQVDRAR